MSLFRLALVPLLVVSLSTPLDARGRVITPRRAPGAVTSPVPAAARVPLPIRPTVLYGLPLSMQFGMDFNAVPEMAPQPILDFRSVPESSMTPLRGTVTTLQNNAERGRGAENGRVLDRTFDGSLSLPAAGTPIGINRVAGQDATESFAEGALRRFFPGLRRGDTPAVYKADPGTKPLGRPTDPQLDASVKLSPLSNPEREKAVRQLFIQAGADPSEIVTQKIPRLWGEQHNNIIVTKKGRTDKVIVVGGHHDKVHAGAGTIDNWTGATMVANLYAALRDVETEHTIVFVTFGAEEKGLVGSRHYLKELGREQRSKIQAMVNLDTLAVDGTFSWLNNSDHGLLAQADRVAARDGFDLERKGLRGGDSDHSAFRRYGIPAMMFFGASEKVIWDIIHSSNDNYAAFSLQHYVNNFDLAKAFIEDIDADPPTRNVEPPNPAIFDAANFRHWTQPPPPPSGSN